MLKTLIDTAKFSDIMEIVSPALFRVMPVGGLRKAATRLTRNRLSGKRFERASAARQKALGETGMRVNLAPLPRGGEATEVADGETILELYFAQLFDDAPVLLDLRRDRFARVDEDLIWDPKAYFVSFDDDFLSAMRGIYEGFYTEDDELFQESLAELNLEGVGELFRAHFGGGDQTAVEFDVEHFRDTFMQIFEYCKEEEIELHHDFVPLGIYLATLYEHLGSLGGAYDVRSAYFSARDPRDVKMAS